MFLPVPGKGDVLVQPIWIENGTHRQRIQVIEWDSASQSIKGMADSTKLLKRAAVRPGFEYSAATT